MRDLDGRTLSSGLTRRALGIRLVGAAAVGLGVPAAGAAPAPLVALAPDLRDAALRGLALAAHRGDPVNAAAARAAMARLAETDPEAGLLGRIYQLLDVRPAAYWQDHDRDEPSAAEADLAALHGAIRACLPVAFDYTDRGGNVTSREVLPLALVHPPQGVKLLGWCESRAGFRQFFVRSIDGLVAQPGDFSAQRLALLQGLLEKEEGAV